MQPHKVLFLIDRLGRGGAAQVVVNVAMSLNRERFSPMICLTRNLPMNGYDEVLRKAGVPLICLKRKSSLDVFSWKPLWKILPTIKILHSHESGSNFWGRIWGPIFKVPIIITQDHTASDEKIVISRICDRILSSLSDRIIAVSEHDRELLIHYEKLPPNKVVTLYNGIDFNKFDCKFDKDEARRKANLPEGQYLMAIVARLFPQKNHRGFFAALKLLPEEVTAKSLCLIVGGGELEIQLRKDVQKLGLQKLVSFLGERTDVPIILRALDLLVLPSDWECLPMIVLEALASKCPVVATAVGGIPEILSLVNWPTPEPRNPLALAEAIKVVFQMTEEEREQIAEFGRQTIIQKFSKESCVMELEKLYDSLLTSCDGSSLKGKSRAL